MRTTSSTPIEFETEPNGRQLEGGDAAYAATRGGRYGKFIWPVVVFVLVVGAGETLTRAEVFNRFILPRPSAIASAMVELAGESFFWDAVRVTVLETTAGWALGSIVGFILGAAIASSTVLRQGLYPYVVLFQGLPKVALAPVFVVWFGFGISSKIVMAAAICFFPLLVNTISGLDSVNADAKSFMEAYGASKRHVFMKLSLPEALTSAFAGLKTGMSFALVGAIVGEFVGAQEGMGSLIATFNFGLQVDSAFAVLVYLTLVGLILYLAIEWLEQKIIFWRGHGVA